MLVLELLFDLLGYQTARLLVPLLTLGAVAVERPDAAETGFNWLGFKRAADGRLLMSFTMAGSLGCLLWLLVLVAVLVLLGR